MNHLKSSIRVKENVRKTYFAVKLILLIILQIFYTGDTIVTPFLEKYEILNHMVRALIFLFSANLIFPWAASSHFASTCSSEKKPRYNPILCLESTESSFYSI
jgi:hypothetical protein